VHQARACPPQRAPARTARAAPGTPRPPRPRRRPRPPRRRCPTPRARPRLRWARALRRAGPGRRVPRRVRPCPGRPRQVGPCQQTLSRAGPCPGSPGWESPCRASPGPEDPARPRLCPPTCRPGRGRLRGLRARRARPRSCRARPRSCRARPQGCRARPRGRRACRRPVRQGPCNTRAPQQRQQPGSAERSAARGGARCPHNLGRLQDKKHGHSARQVEGGTCPGRPAEACPAASWALGRRQRAAAHTAGISQAWPQPDWGRSASRAPAAGQLASVPTPYT